MSTGYKLWQWFLKHGDWALATLGVYLACEQRDPDLQRLGITPVMILALVKLCGFLTVIHKALLPEPDAFPTRPDIPAQTPPRT